MPIFEYRCDCGMRFERLVPRDQAAPECPECGGATRKIPSGPRLARGASPGSGTVPVPWRGTVGGGPEKMQREVQLRQNMQAKGAEHAGNPGSTPSTE
jgi:putative FmdB family regulatory protein